MFLLSFLAKPYYKAFRQAFLLCFQLVHHVLQFVNVFKVYSTNICTLNIYIFAKYSLFALMVTDLLTHSHTPILQKLSHLKINLNCVLDEMIAMDYFLNNC